MNRPVLTPSAPRRLRKHSPEFKAQVIAACLQPGISIAAVALANQLNANFLRSWVKAHRDQQGACVPANPVVDRRNESTSARPPTLVPATLRADAATSGDIQIEIRRQQTVVQITWPTSQATACAQWLREIWR